MAVNMQAVIQIIFYIGHMKIAAVPASATNPYAGLYNLCKMSEIHEIGGVRHQIFQRIIFGGQLAGINLDS
jgi:hypothetical protein